MSITLRFYPAVVERALKESAISLDQLSDAGTLKNIFSNSVVSKIAALNTKARMTTENSQAILRAMGHDWVIPYVEAEPAVKPILGLPDNVITYLSKDGDEAASNEIAKQLHLFYVPFTVRRVRGKEYAVLFQEGVAVDSPQEKRTRLLRDMQEMCNLISADVSSADLVKESVFETFTSVLSK